MKCDDFEGFEYIYPFLDSQVNTYTGQNSSNVSSIKMEPNSWSNYNQHYGRIAHSTGLPSSVNRYDLQLLEQPGLGPLPSSLSPPTHAGLTTPRPLPTLPPMAYSHQLHNMSQFLDTVSPLQPTFAPQSHYKSAVPYSQPSYQMDPLLSPRMSHDSVIGMSRYIQPSLTPPDVKPLFNPDLHSPRNINSLDGKSWGSSMPPISSSPYSTSDSYLLSGYHNSPPLTSPSKTSSHRSQFSTSESSYDRVSSPRSPHIHSPYQSINSPSRLQEPRGHVQLPSAHHNPPPRHHEDMHSTNPVPMHHDSADIRYLEERQLYDYTSRNPTRVKKEVYQDSPEQPILGNLSSLNTSTNNQIPYQPHMSYSTQHKDYSDRVYSDGRNKELDLFDHYQQQSSPVLGGGDHISVAPRVSQPHVLSNNDALRHQSTNLQMSPSTDMASNMSQPGAVSQTHNTHYDPVSPVNPATDHHGDSFSTISLHDLHTFSSDTNSIIHGQSNLSPIKQDTALLDLSPDYGKSKHKKPKQRKSKSKKNAYAEQYSSQVPQTFQQTTTQQMSNQSQQVPFQSQMLPHSNNAQPPETHIVRHLSHDLQGQQLVPEHVQTQYHQSSHNQLEQFPHNTQHDIRTHHSSNQKSDDSILSSESEQLPMDYGTQKQNLSPYSQASKNYPTLPAEAHYSSNVHPDPLNSDEGPLVDHFGNPVQSMPASVIHTTPLPVQAIADSTTVPKPKGKRGRKKKQPVLPPAELITAAKPYKHYQDDSLGDSNIIKDNDMDNKTLTQINTSITLPHEMPITKEPQSRLYNNSSEGLGLLEDFSQTGSSVLMTDDNNSCIEKTIMRNESSEFLRDENVSMDIGLEQSSKETMETDMMNFEEEKSEVKNVETDISLSDQLIDAALEAGSDPPSEKEDGETTITVPKIQVVTSELEFDDDFQHLASPPKVVQDSALKMIPGKDLKPSKGSQFLSSFLSFIDGEKSETLSSVVQTPVKRPPMPKYIPDLSRPRRRSSVNERSSSLDSTQDTSAFKEDDVTSAFKEDDVTSAFKEDDMSSAFNEDDVVLPQTDQQPTPQHRGRNKSGAKKGVGKQKSKTKRVKPDDDDEDYYEEAIGSDVEKVSAAEKEPTPPPVRRQSSRKAKEVKRKYVEELSDDDAGKVDKTDGDEDYNDGDEVTYTSEEEALYDSDDDPAWRPFAADKRQSSRLSSRSRRSSLATRARRNSGMMKFKRMKQVHLPSENDQSDSGDTDNTSIGARVPVVNPEPTNNTPTRPPPPDKFFQRGTFLIEKRDLTCYENYPIWKVTDGNMLQKFQLIVEGGEVKHKASLTYSRWTLVMHDEYVPVAVELKCRDKNNEVVSVKEEDRPKPPTDGSLERQYEDDPLVENFNVYLQILLSQALEPGFLKAIRNSTDDFYIRHMLKVDELIQTRVSDIEKSIKWTNNFKEAMQTRPHYRTLERQNLKQLCQGCRRVNEAACRSIHLFGVMYDRSELTDMPTPKTGQTSSQEFLIGKTAALFMSTYHGLVHYKYNLFKRCLAKVTLVKESEKTQDNAEVLDSCLHNRAWVLKLYEDLKEMLEKP